MNSDDGWQEIRRYRISNNPSCVKLSAERMTNMFFVPASEAADIRILRSCCSTEQLQYHPSASEIGRTRDRDRE